MLIYQTSKYEIYCYVVGQLQENCYFIVNKSTSETWIIDPGDEGDFLSEEIIRNDFQPTKIILTHAHFDHIGGVLPLKLNFDLKIYLNLLDQKIYQNAGDSAAFWQNHSFDPVPPIDIDLQLLRGINAENDIPLDQKVHAHDWKIIPTPGHTPGCICLYNSSEKIIFTGDTLFAGDIGRTDFAYSSPPAMLKSLQKLIKLPPDIIAFPGHGQSTTIEAELKNNSPSFS